jgi:NADH-quinone oxidoreductase subunit C/D
MIAALTLAQEINGRFASALVSQETVDGIATFWVERDRAPALLRFLKEGIELPYKMLYDLSAIDERMRMHRQGQPPSDFTVVYHLFSFDRNEYVRVKVALAEGRLPRPASLACGPPRIGTSAKYSTCSGSFSMGIRIWNAS